MLKGHLDAIVLAALEAGPAHGYAIIEAIKRRSGSTFDLPEGTVYPALHRLEQAGLLASSWTTPPGALHSSYPITTSWRAGEMPRLGQGSSGCSSRR